MVNFNTRLDRQGADPDRIALAHQSLGRPLTDAETALAAALMEIYAGGAAGAAEVAAGLTERGVAHPEDGSTAWTAERLETALAALNRDLDAAYAENGYGA